MAKTKRSETFYSYSAKRNLRKEELAAYRRIGLATVVIVGLIAAGYFVGIPLLAKMGGGSDQGSASGTLGTTDTIPPTAPRLETLPEAVRKSTLTIKGSSESNSTVIVSINDQEAGTFISDKEGIFQGDVTLTTGNNAITAIAKDVAGNKSRATKEIIVLFDATPPKVTLSADLPTTTTASSVTVKGKTEAGSEVKLNGKQLILADDNSFESEVTLQMGSNTITLIATDKAGNTTTVTRMVEMTSPDQASSSASLNP